jgi:hypothetical protein
MRSHWRDVIAASVVIVSGVWLVAACGSGATEGLDDDQSGAAVDETDNADDPSDGGGSGTVDENDEDDEYSWGLPSGNPGVDPLGAAVYDELRNSCAAGQGWLDQHWEDVPSPQTVLLFQAAVYVCDGDRESGRQMFADAEARYQGWSGVDGYKSVCEIFKSVVSVLQQVERSTVDCPGGDVPDWPQPDCKDDPRTNEDECVTASTDNSTSESTEPPTESTEPPTASTEPTIESTEPPVPTEPIEATGVPTGGSTEAASTPSPGTNAK